MRADTLAVVLAGGRGRRMGGREKALLEMGGRTILARIVGRLAPQVGALVLNANGDPARFAPYRLDMVPDDVPGQPGPLAGVLAGMEAAAARALSLVASAPADTPFLPPDLIARLHAARMEAGADVAVAASAGYEHPTVALWPASLRGRLRRALTVDGLRRVRDFQARLALVIVEWPGASIDPFFNVNTPEDLAAGEVLLQSIRSDAW